MGMYTEMSLSVDLVENTPPNVVNALHYLAGNVPSEPEKLPDHPLFRCPRWSSVLEGRSYYFPGASVASFSFDDIGNRYFLTFRADMKNYANEQEKFLTLIEPWLETRGAFVGHQRYEEETRPTLIYVTDRGKFRMEGLQ